MPTLFVTGVSSGLGEATARLFAKRGWNVVGTVRRDGDGASLEEAPNVRILRLDVTDEAAVAAVAVEACSAFGHVDVVVNNAGYFQMGPLETSTMAQVRAQYETNVFGLIGVTKAFLPHLRAQGSGLFVNVASVSAENGYPFASVYSSTKSAVATLTEALNVELAPVGLRAKAILPGLHATEIFTKVDAVDEVPEGYRPLLRRFFELQGAAKGSPPEVVATAIWTAATDGRDDKVRYYAGPDATSVPLAKRLLGGAGYWRFFRGTLLEGPGAVARLLTPKGTAAVEFGESVKRLRAKSS